MQKSPSRADERNAFTLIELMVVITLIGILSAMIIPEMKGTFEDSLLRSTGRELINTFDLAGSRAVSLSQPHRVQLDEHTRRYSVERRASEREADVFVPVRDLPGSEGMLDDRITIEIHQGGELALNEPPPRVDGIGFYPDGTADATEILLRDRAGFRLALRLNPVTARVRIVELERE